MSPGFRSALGRRTSSVLAARRSSQTKKRFDDLEVSWSWSCFSLPADEAFSFSATLTSFYLFQAIGSASGSKETVSEAGKVSVN